MQWIKSVDFTRFESNTHLNISVLVFTRGRFFLFNSDSSFYLDEISVLEVRLFALFVGFFNVSLSARNIWNKEDNAWI